MFFKKKKYKAQNSRRFKRFQADYLIKYQVPGAEGEFFVSNMKDLSAGGAKFWTEQYVVEGALVKVSFLVPPLDLQVDTLARVIRVRQVKDSSIYYVAVRFIEISEEAKLAIDSFIERLASEPEAKRYVSSAQLVNRTVTA